MKLSLRPPTVPSAATTRSSPPRHTSQLARGARHTRQVPLPERIAHGCEGTLHNALRVASALL